MSRTGPATTSPGVALLHYSCPPVIGGVETILYEQASLIAEHGLTVTTMTGEGGAASMPGRVVLDSRLGSRGQLIEEIRTELNLAGDPPRFHALRVELAALLRPLVGESRRCLVHNVMTMPFNLALSAALADLAREFPGRIVAWTHDVAACNPLYAGQLHPGPPWDLLQRPQPGITYIAISQAVQQQLCRAGGLAPAEVEVVPNGIDPLAHMRPTALTSELLARGDLLSASPVMLMPVRITRRKRIDLALRATAELRQRGHRPRLLVTGPPGPHDRASSDHASELLRLRSELDLETEATFLFQHSKQEGYPVDPESMGQLFQLADLLLLTSSSEGFGLPLLEAALHRLPTVAVDIPVLAEFNLGQVVVVPADPGPEQVADAVERSLAQSGTEARREVIRRFAWESIWTSHLERLING